VAAQVADLVRAFDEEMQRVRASAYPEAETRLAEARAHAERMELQAEEVRLEAQRQADEILTLEGCRAALLENIRRIREGLGQTVEAVDAILTRMERTVVIPDAVRES
jgi:hypothetical protein